MIDASSHNGVKAMLSLHFIRTGKLEISHGNTYSLLFDKRHSSDYEDFSYCDAPLVDYLYPKSEAFINAIENLIAD